MDKIFCFYLQKSGHTESSDELYEVKLYNIPRLLFFIVTDDYIQYKQEASMGLQTSERYMMRAQPRTKHLDALIKENRKRKDCFHFVNFLKTVLT